MKARWGSQRYPPDGGVASEGIRRQLGAPSLDPLTVLVRETAQNSWDARSGDAEVRLTYGLYTVDPARCRAFRELLLPAPDRGDALDRELHPGALILTVSDRGTTGLGGELRSDRTGPGRPDFVNFVRNVGEHRSGGHDGGTYGFGKAILFSLSRADTVIVSTRCRYRDRPQRRLIGVMVGESYERDGLRYTGRHWWGDVATDGIVDPLLDDAAEEVAEAFGLPGFDDDELGTDLVVVAPTLGEVEEGQQGRDIGEAADVIAGSVLWHLWPKLVTKPGSPRPPMHVRVIRDGFELPHVDPGTAPGLGSFVKAFLALDGDRAQAHERKSEPRNVGRLASVPALDPVPAQGGPVALCAPFEGRPRHCARMRSVELVVDYLEGPVADDPGLGYAAVFRSSPEADPHFAKAEPPTHDSWQTKHLSGTDLGVVRSTNKFIGERLREAAGLVRDDVRASAVPLGALAARLARLLPTTPAEGATGTDGDDGPEGGAKATCFSWVERPRLVVVDDEALVAGTVRVVDATSPVVLEAVARVAVDGGTEDEDEAPAGAERPEVLGWRSHPDGPLHAGGELRVAPAAPRTWTVVVRPAPGTATVVDVRRADRGEGDAGT